MRGFAPFLSPRGGNGRGLFSPLFPLLNRRPARGAVEHTPSLSGKKRNLFLFLSQYMAVPIFFSAPQTMDDTPSFSPLRSRHRTVRRGTFFFFLFQSVRIRILSLPLFFLAPARVSTRPSLFFFAVKYLTGASLAG